MQWCVLRWGGMGWGGGKGGRWSQDARLRIGVVRTDDMVLRQRREQLPELLKVSGDQRCFQSPVKCISKSVDPSALELSCCRCRIHLSVRGKLTAGSLCGVLDPERAGTDDQRKLGIERSTRHSHSRSVAEHRAGPELLKQRVPRSHQSGPHRRIYSAYVLAAEVYFKPAAVVEVPGLCRRLHGWILCTVGVLRRHATPLQPQISPGSCSPGAPRAQSAVPLRPHVHGPSKPVYRTPLESTANSSAVPPAPWSFPNPEHQGALGSVLALARSLRLWWRKLHGFAAGTGPTAHQFAAPHAECCGHSQGQGRNPYWCSIPQLQRGALLHDAPNCAEHSGHPEACMAHTLSAFGPAAA